MTGNCDTCIKFRKECPNGVFAPDPDGKPWDGHDGGCSLWMGKECLQCLHINRTLYNTKMRLICGKNIGWLEHTDPNGCKGFAPKVSQTTLEGF